MRTALLFLLMTIAPICTACAVETVSVLPGSASQQARNKAIAGRVFDEIFNQGKFEVADEIYAKDFVNHGLHRNASLDEDQAAVHAEKKAFPDLKISVNLMAAQGDLVTVVWTFRGTHTGGGYYGLPATGTRVELRGITVWRIVDGKIREEWTSFDQLTVAREILTHLKWLLLGLLLAVLILAWLLCRVVSRPTRPRLAKATS